MSKSMNLEVPVNHVIWRYKNSWRPFCDRWWLHWLDLRLLWWDLKDAYHRALRGWGNGDIWDLMTYHTAVTIGLLECFRENHQGYMDGMTPDEYDAKLDLALDAWRAKWDILNNIGWDTEVDYQEWRKPLEERWEKGIPVFLEIYDSLWL